MGGTTAVYGKWVLAYEDGAARILTDRWVVVEGDTIAAIVRDRPSADRVIDGRDNLVLPGLINLHNHTVSALLFRGMTEDRPSVSWATEMIYGLLMPVGDMTANVLTAEELRAAIALGLLEIIKGGTTTLMDVFRYSHNATIDVAREMGLRLYGTPYLFSTAKMTLGADGKPAYETATDAASDLTRAIDLFRKHDGTANGRIRIALGPHGVDSCDPELLAATRRAASELGCLVNIHLGQSRSELDLVRERYGRSPAECLEYAGLLGPDVLAAHCIYLTDAELALLRRTDTTIVNCPQTFARGGVTAPFHRFAGHGIRTVVGTDGYTMDMVGELRAAGLISKIDAQQSALATAADLIHAATLGGAEALRRTDLGRIAPGARADLLAIDMMKPHLQPVSDPIKTFLWNARGGDVSAVVVDGEVLVDRGVYQKGDEAAIIAAGAQAIGKVWDHARATGVL